MAWNALVNSATGKIFPSLIPEGGGVALTKGQLISANNQNVEVAVPVGANGTILSADSNSVNGLSYVVVPGAVPLSKGELIAGDVANTPTIVTAPAFPAQEGWVLTATAAAVDGTGLEWKDAGQASFTGVGQMQYGGAAPGFDDTPLNLGTAGQIMKVNLGATAPEWADPQGATPFTAVGQMQYGGAAPGFADTPLALGTAGQIMKVNVGATAPEWADVAGETILAGAGLTITNPAINTISINQGFLNKGDLIVGTGQNVGVIVPCPAFDQSLVLGTSATTPSGLEWKNTGGGYSGPTINRSSGIDPVLINAPTTASDTMICVADHPNDESWVAISDDPVSTETEGQRNFPFIDSAGNVYRFFPVFTASPVDGSPIPAVQIHINYPSVNDQRKCVFFNTDPNDPVITPTINGCFENSGVVWIYGSFDNIAIFEPSGGPPGPGPTASPAGCVVAAIMAGQTPSGNPALVNNILDGQGNVGVTCNDFATGGPPRINCGFFSPWNYDEGSGPYNNLVFAGYFDAQYQTTGLPVSTDMQNIIIYDTLTTGPKWFDSGQMDIRKMATTAGPTGEVFTGYCQTNIAAPCQVYGGKFTSVNYDPIIPMDYLGILFFPGGDGNAAAWVAAPATALTGDVQYCIASGTNVNTGLIQGAFGTFGAVGGGLAYFDLLTGAITQINLASLPSTSVWTDTYYGLVVANIKADPVSPAVLHDVCVFNVPNVGAISYRTPCTGVGVGTWVLNPNPTGQVTNSDVKCIMYGVVAQPTGVTLPNPSLYVLDNEPNLNSSLKYLKQGTGTPLSAVFQLSPAVAGTCQFRTGGVGVFSICTMEESTAQYFMASPQQNVSGKFDWVCMGQPQATTLFT
jgi:hypothetical protein|nr:MAG: hypothetical protein [Lake Baikal virophage 4]